MRYFYLVTFIAFTLSVQSQNIPVLKYNEAEKLWTNNSDTLYLVNFWATWCVPCVQELPDFIKLNEELRNEKFKMILVSLDFPNHANSRVIPFIKTKNIKSPVIILDDDANIWINKVNKDWDGSIPVTQFVKQGKKEFHKGTLNYKELLNIVKPKIK